MSFKLSKEAESFLINEMCICLDDLVNHVKNVAPAKMEFFQGFLEFIAILKLPHDSYELGDTKYHENDEYLDREIMGYSKKYGIERDTEEYFIVDSIRHAFSSFMFGGLEWLYKNREARIHRITATLG